MSDVLGPFLHALGKAHGQTEAGRARSYSRVTPAEAATGLSAPPGYNPRRDRLVVIHRFSDNLDTGWMLMGEVDYGASAEISSADMGG